MSFTRLIYHYLPDLVEVKGMLTSDSVAGCWFELDRLGGCGAGELRLKAAFRERERFEVGEWIAFEPALGERWYVGRIEERICDSPAGITLILQGMSVELGERFIGGFGIHADGVAPLKYGATDTFPQDPDVAGEKYIQLTEPEDIIKYLLDAYIVGRSHITYDPADIEPGIPGSGVVSAKFRGEESVRSIIKELAMRAGDMSWGVTAAGKFYFLRQRQVPTATYQETIDLTSLREQRELDMIYNRVVLTGDYIYDREDHSADIARRSFRWRGNYTEPVSKGIYGERRLRLWIPWIRTKDDARRFLEQFFAVYAYGKNRYTLETVPQENVPYPWLGPVKIMSASGEELLTGVVEKVRVEFDHAVVLKMEIGPVDPRKLWAEPPQDERFELPDQPPAGFGGGNVGPGRNSSSSSSEENSVVTTSSETSYETSSEDSNMLSFITSVDSSSVTSSAYSSDESSAFSFYSESSDESSEEDSSSLWSSNEESTSGEFSFSSGEMSSENHSQSTATSYYSSSSYHNSSTYHNSSSYYNSSTYYNNTSTYFSSID